MAILDRGDATGECHARVVVCSTALSAAKPRADDAMFDDVVIECAPVLERVEQATKAVMLKLTRDEALQLCADILIQLKTLPILKPKASAGTAF